MKKHRQRGFRIPTRIILSALLLLIQLLFIVGVSYDVTAGSAWAYSFSVFLGIATVVFIMNRRGNPDHKIAWIVFILVFPIFGITVFLLWGGGRVAPFISKRMKISEARFLRYLREKPDVRNKLKYHDLIHSRQADYVTAETGLPLYDGTSTKFLCPGEEFLPCLIEELEKAEKYIFIEFFIIAEGKMWDAVHTVLKKKAESGVEIKIIFDDFGSIKRQKKGFLAKLRAEKIKVAAFNPINPFMNIFMNNRDHRKIVIIDGKTAFTGGINIGDEYINKEERCGYWLDSAVMIKGNAVKSFLGMFCAMWEFTTGKRIRIKNYIAESDLKEEGFVLPYCDGPLQPNNPAEGLYMQILGTAQKYVYIMTPYLIIDNNMKNSLSMAAKAGIDVRIITPAVPDKWYVHPVTRYNYLELLEAGVKIYEFTPGFIHSKIFVSDDKVATVGTVNMDYRSFVFHFECGAWICNNNTVFDIREHFKNTLGQCKEITVEIWKKQPLNSRFKQWILHIFAPFM